MATRGRKPNPIAEFGKARFPVRPPELHGKAQALKEWRRVTTELEQKGLAMRATKTMVLLHCLAYQDFHDAGEMIEAEGKIVAGERGARKANPGYQLRREAAAMMLKILSELGLSPTAAARVNPGENSEQDEFIELLRGMQ